MAGLVIYGIGAVIIWLALRSIYRLYFHPLSKFPGAKLAAITSGYEFYYNVIKSGSYIWEVDRMHKVYGPIIRIGPREIRIKDPEYYDEIYASSARRREKDPLKVAQFALEGSAFASISPESHRERRAPLEKFFSRQSISKLEPLIYESIDKLSQHLQKAYKSNKVVRLDAGFAGLTSDIIYQYTYGQSAGNLDQEDFNESVRDGANALLRGGHIAYFLPVLQTITYSLPLWMLKKISPSAFTLASQKHDLYLRSVEALHKKTPTDNGHTILDTLVSPSMPAHLRTAERITNEGHSITVAGIETTARTLSVGTYYLFTNESIRLKLRQELREAMPTLDSRPTWYQLEKLPYLSAVVNESLRMSIGISDASPRVAPTESLVYNNYVIPPGTMVSQVHYFILTDPTIFPNPHTFDPERWIRAAEKGERLEKYIVNFSKGSRICLGKNLAYAELFLVFAALVRQFELELYETPKSVVEFVRDFGFPAPDEGDLKIRALVKEVIGY
ncbi:Cytochrome P450 [Aspergillus sclerotialis]|uniref:Cytochrome P450 n=1 Tax=Aspergillus sclerotialis TaxID=2070753 RepID=A0A3A2ZVT6_9EURO|nr:Cytochrome P450 [Aspergillus sclerotialis]